MAILTILPQEKGALPKGARVTAAAALSAKSAHGHDKVVGLVLGAPGQVDAAAKEAAQLGFDEVLAVTDAALENYLAIPFATAVVAAVGEVNPTLVVGPADTFGKDLMPRIAQKLGAAQASDVIEFLPGGAFRRPMFAGNIIADVELTTEKKVVTIRGTAFEPAQNSSAACSIKALSPSGLQSEKQKFISFDTVASERPELTEAEIVVSGGRAMKSSENFSTYIMPLADALGAAVGASRAAVDSGYAPNDWQVGQTGKVVAPALYIAIGISGAIQHLAGMKDSKVIVAINKDPEAPIFEVADYGLVADLYDVVPKLTEAVKKARG